MASIDENQEISLFTELLVKEDLLQLVGFLSFREKKWFNLLKSVQGVGAKVALAILNNLTPEDLLKSVRMKNEIAFKSVSGVGPRMAQRIIVELSGRKEIMTMNDLKKVADGGVTTNTEESDLILIQELLIIINLFIKSPRICIIASPSRNEGKVNFIIMIIPICWA